MSHCCLAYEILKRATYCALLPILEIVLWGNKAPKNRKVIEHLVSDILTRKSRLATHLLLSFKT